MRAHLITLFPALFFVFILFVSALASIVFFWFAKIDLTAFFSFGEIVLIYLAFFLLLFGFVLFRFLLWYFNIYVVTNERIIDFDFHRFLHREISDTALAKIQDITSQISGPLQTFFNFGNVFVQTASERPRFEFENIPNPDKVVKEISAQARLEEAEKPGVVA